MVASSLRRSQGRLTVRLFLWQAWDIMQPLSEGKWWAYAALCELIGDFERAAKHIAKIILSEVGVEEHSRILKKRPDGKYRSYFMEVHERALTRTYTHKPVSMRAAKMLN
jgi:hypothetical protein